MLVTFGVNYGSCTNSGAATCFIINTCQQNMRTQACTHTTSTPLWAKEQPKHCFLFWAADRDYSVKTLHFVYPSTNCSQKRRLPFHVLSRIVFSLPFQCTYNTRTHALTHKQIRARSLHFSRKNKDSTHCGRLTKMMFENTTIELIILSICGNPQHHDA